MQDSMTNVEERKVDMKKLGVVGAAIAVRMCLNAATYYASPNPVDPSTEGYCESEATAGTIADAVDKSSIPPRP